MKRKTRRGPSAPRPPKATAGNEVTSFASYDHRTHPAKIVRPPAGHCRWCGRVILNKHGEIARNRSWCGPMCVHQYKIRADPQFTRRHIFLRDGGACAECFRVWKNLNDPWEADHIIPLFLAAGDWSFWEPENVQLLCREPCHVTKTSQDRNQYGFVLEMMRGKKPPSEG